MKVQWIVDLGENLKEYAIPFLILLTLFCAGCILVAGIKMTFAKSKDDKNRFINNFIHIIVSYIVIIVICVLLFSILSYFANGDFIAWVRSYPLFKS